MGFVDDDHHGKARVGNRRKTGESANIILAIATGDSHLGGTRLTCNPVTRNFSLGAGTTLFNHRLQLQHHSLGILARNHLLTLRRLVDLQDRDWFAHPFVGQGGIG